MDPDLRWIARATRARSVELGERIQSLWSGYGEIFRVHLEGAAVPSAVVKSVNPPASSRRSDRVSHARKCRSYDVESVWYRRFGELCGDSCRVAKLFHFEKSGEKWRFLLEDLDAAGYPERKSVLAPDEIDRCLGWLARFHARFLGMKAHGLWSTGTYWHLETRREELNAIADRDLRTAAPMLDTKLQNAEFKTLVHGDAKVANFCFAPGGPSVAAVDFQYVGGGCGMKDVAYLLSDHPAPHPELAEARHLDHYFAELRTALSAGDSRVDAEALEREWRELYPIAYADFCRFLAGWAPGVWQSDAHAQSVVERVIRSLARR
jgi:hypothetical protein